MALRRRVWTAGKLLLLCAALGGTFLLFAFASMRLALRAREVEVPDFVNRTANEATAIGSDLNLAIKVDEQRRLDPKIAAGHVVAQDPRAGTNMREQRTVRVWLSAGARAARVPSLTGQTERTASLRLAQDGFELAGISEVRSDSFPADVVVSQDPAATLPGTRVALLVNRAEQAATFVMPDLIGVNGDRAAAILRGQGFRVAVVGSVPYPGAAAGVVVDQSPKAGFQIAASEPISIVVSR